LLVEYWSYGGVDVDYKLPVKVEDPHIYDPRMGPVYELLPLDSARPTLGILIYSRA
jgi:hypothetical protein